MQGVVVDKSVGYEYRFPKIELKRSDSYYSPKGFE